MFTFDPTNSLYVVGTIEATGTFWQAVQPVSGTFWQTTQPISGSVSVLNFPTVYPISGTVTVTNTGTFVSQPLAIYNPTTPALASAQSVQLQGDSAGSLYVDIAGRQPTYVACKSAFVPLADAGLPFFVLQGSATKTVKIRHVRLSWGAVTGNAAPNVISMRRFSAVTGGTPNVVPLAQMDTVDPAATAVVSQYSALPSVATPTPLGAGEIVSDYMQWTTNAAGVAGPTIIEFDFGLTGKEPLVVRGTSEWIGISISAMAASGGTMALGISWTEE
jgi:hypothetical protein